MNKKRGIIIGIFALIVTMVIGYAYFSENIEIKGTAKASGNFDLSYTCEVMDSLGHATNLGTCNVNEKDNEIITVSTLKKPTDNVVYCITITNDGTIPAVLKTIDSPNNFAEDGVSPGDYLYFNKNTFLLAQDIVVVDPESVNSTSFYGDSAIEAEKITIQPGKSILLQILHEWGDSDGMEIEQPKLPEGGATMEYNVTLGFSQITN